MFINVKSYYFIYCQSVAGISLLLWIIAALVKGGAAAVLLAPLILPFCIFACVAGIFLGREKKDDEAFESREGIEEGIESEDDAIQISCIEGGLQSASVKVRRGEVLLIGRDPEKANLVLDNPKISRLHCGISYYAEDGLISVINYSRNGISVDGKEINGYKEEVFVNRGVTLRVSSKDAFRIY